MTNSSNVILPNSWKFIESRSGTPESVYGDSLPSILETLNIPSNVKFEVLTYEVKCGLLLSIFITEDSHVSIKNDCIGNDQTLLSNDEIDEIIDKDAGIVCIAFGAKININNLYSGFDVRSGHLDANNVAATVIVGAIVKCDKLYLTTIRSSEIVARKASFINSYLTRVDLRTKKHVNFFDYIDDNTPFNDLKIDLSKAILIGSYTECPDELED